MWCFNMSCLFGGIPCSDYREFYFPISGIFILQYTLQTGLGNSFPVGKIINALKSYYCIPLDKVTYQFTYYDEVLEACGKIFGMELDNRYLSRQQIQRLLRY